MTDVEIESLKGNPMAMMKDDKSNDDLHAEIVEVLEIQKTGKLDDSQACLVRFKNGDVRWMMHRDQGEWLEVCRG
ncbi:hypothetical protein J3R80_08935 [Aliiroseovarius sp. Z3]|uniref:hypothetical protein n=1 Tax=Aliiroseovarius sp. Z3 TaxID=2811402 RepID=UPI0023B23D27|nr:hypothetical protein [Aliiroseovarius sp. Z3]MDE9450590.1 hypothetical protein [Aliiroseovarius sp. Z3]